MQKISSLMRVRLHISTVFQIPLGENFVQWATFFIPNTGLLMFIFSFSWTAELIMALNFLRS